jgi:hypothetical protein
LKSLNDSIIADLQVILENMNPGQCGYIYDCIKESINDESGGGKQYNNKTKLKLSEIVCRSFNFMDNK